MRYHVITCGTALSASAQSHLDAGRPGTPMLERTGTTLIRIDAAYLRATRG
jgi:hypothetical protein